MPLMALMALLWIPTPAIADPGTEAEFLARVNDTRSAFGLVPLQVEAGIQAHARAHAEEMMDAGEIFHSRSDELDAAGGQGWEVIGENIGRGQSATSLHNAFMASPAHRDNILGDFNYVGIGTKSDNGYLYVTVVFMKKSPTSDSTGSAADIRMSNESMPCREGSACDTLAFQDPGGRFDLWDELAENRQVESFYYGNPGDVPLGGDWDCDGSETLGLYRRSDGYVYLTNANAGGLAEITYYFGDPGDFPIAGDFDGDGCDTVSLYRPSEARFHIINDLGSSDRGLGRADQSFVFGGEGDKPFAGDFDGDGIDTVGLHREATGLIYLRNSHVSGFADDQFTFGDPGDVVLAGDWDGDGDDTVGAYRPSTGNFNARNSNTAGPAEATLFSGAHAGLVALRP